MTTPAATPRKTSNAYNIFILVLTVLSLAIMERNCSRYLVQKCNYLMIMTT